MKRKIDDDDDTDDNIDGDDDDDDDDTKSDDESDTAPVIKEKPVSSRYFDDLQESLTEQLIDPLIDIVDSYLTDEPATWRLSHVIKKLV